MQSLLVFLAVAALSVLASSQRVLQAARAFQLAQLAGSGLLFLVLGALLGPHAAAILSPDDVGKLRPLLAFGLGAGGLLVGLNMDVRVLRHLPRQVIAASFAQSTVTFVVVAAPLVGLLFFSSTFGWATSLGAATMLGAAGSVSSGHLAVQWYRSGRMERARGWSVSLVAMLDDFSGLGVLAVALVVGAAVHPGVGLGLVFLTLVLGALCGALLAFLIHRISDDAELMTVLLGGMALVSGAAAYLRISALLCGLACGATLALVGGPSVEKVYRTLARFERPMYLLLVFLIGTHLDVAQWEAWVMLPVFVSVRFFGKLWGGQLASRMVGDTLSLPPRLGYALLAQGAVSLCILTEYLMLVPGQAASLVFSIGALGAVANEVLASRAFRFSLGAPPDDGQAEEGPAGAEGRAA